MEVRFEVVEVRWNDLRTAYATVDMIVGAESLRIYGVSVIRRDTRRMTVYMPQHRRAGVRRAVVDLSDGLYAQFRSVVREAAERAL